MDDSSKKKKKSAKTEMEDEDTKPSKSKSDDTDLNKNEGEDEEEPKRPTKKRSATKKKKKSSSMFDLGNIFWFAVAGGIGYCRYHMIPIPILDDLVLKIRSHLGMDGGGGGGGPPRDDAYSTLVAAREGKAMVVMDLHMQLSKFCGRSGVCTAEYWDALPVVATALQRGPGTWDRKPLKKAQAFEVDEMLAKVAGRPEASRKPVWDALRSISKELLDVSPKSMKGSLASRVALKSTTPPAASVAKVEPAQEDTFVDDM